jgi:hypothetical protein
MDADFVDVLDVGEMWSQRIGLLNDPNAQKPAGWAMRDAKRREFLLSMINALGWSRKISTSDLLRIHQPQFVIDELALQCRFKTK